MPPREADWNFYRSLLAVLRTGSLSAAARMLRLTQPTLGRHIAELEEMLGVTLFVRSPQGLAPTEAALAMRDDLEAAETAFEAAIRESSGSAEDERGVVRLTASEIVGCEVLPHLIAEFGRARPMIAVELALSNRNQDLLRRDADIAVRMVRPEQAALVVRKIGQVKIGLYAHRSYLKRRGTPREENDLAQHTVIGWDRDPSPFRNVDGPTRFLSREFFGFRCDSDLAQLAALRAGVGIGGCQKAIARRDKMLVPVLADRISFRLEMWLAMHEDLRANRRVKLLFDHLAKGLAAYIASQEDPGRGPRD
jgi:DNA-binding transcriptional LysR family regulator